MIARAVDAYWTATDRVGRAISDGFNTFVDWTSPPIWWINDRVFHDFPDWVMRKASRSYREQRERELVLSSARIRPEIIEALEKMRPTTKDPAS